MSGKKGMPRYSEEMKEMVVEEYRTGISVSELNRRYGVSRYAIQSWCGLRKEVELRHAAPSPKGRPRQQQESQEQIIKRLRMENELLRNFLSVVGRK
ncbi:transposase [Caproiciproducens sp.]